MGYFTVYKYNENLYQIKDALGVLATLVIGEEKALLFDTCYGIGDLKQEVLNITTKPLIVVNSHGHMDHSCGNYQFGKIYIDERDVDLVKSHNSADRRTRNINSAKNMKVLPVDFDIEKYLNEGIGQLEFIKHGDVFDLGNLKLEVINMNGHTKGSIGLYIKDWKLMLVSDATCPFVWMFLEESTTVTEYIKMLEEVLKLDFDNFLVGHGARMFPRSKMIDFLNVAKEIDLEKSVKVSFQNFEQLNSYCYTEGELYNQDQCGIVFDPNKL